MISNFNQAVRYYERYDPNLPARATGVVREFDEEIEESGDNSIEGAKKTVTKYYIIYFPLDCVLHQQNKLHIIH